ncbi:uncharacterized protein LOC26515081 isoform X2 [Drosophila ananassae]|uniref:uncharacterized protein LOC26515081 isoform X2 n=1 Tax=Drosophila ananassae TaxID=7217 RepID=UPI001D0005E7|nr:uncharacterized protein LOC26515081 isoform X2 [Drosophila ananassae]
MTIIRMKDRGFMHLNEYCLEMILDYSNFREHISFSQTCSRFREVFGIWARNKYTKVSIVGDVEEKELVLMSLVASNIKGLTIFVDDLVSSFQSLYNLESKNSLIKFCDLVQRMQKLESVKIRQTNQHPITGNLLTALRHLPNLKQMHISTPRQGTKRLGMFHKLEFISIDVELPSRILRRCCASMTNLRTLHLSSEVGSLYLRDVLDHLPHLQDLSFEIDRSWRTSRRRTLEALKIKGHLIAETEAEALAKITSLKKLDCHFSSPACVQHLRNLTSLEILRLSHISSEDISYLYLNVIYSCQNLRFLRILDNNITPKFIERVDEVLAPNEPTNKLTLLIHGVYTEDALREFKSTSLDRKNVLLRSMTATELLALI